MNTTERRAESAPERRDPAYGIIDERTRAIVANGNSWGLQFLLFALLLDVLFRAFVYRQAPWDLMGLVIIAGLISTVYQCKHRVFARGLWWPLLVAGVGALVGIVSGIVFATTGWPAH